MNIQQNCYHICVPEENTVIVKKRTAESLRTSESSGTFRKNLITDQIQEVIQNPASLQSEQIQKVGEALFDALFDSQLKDNFLNFRQDTINQQQKLKVVLEINETAIPEVAAYPWELMCLPQRYNSGNIHFATDLNLSFFRSQYYSNQEDKPSIQLQQGEKLKIALVVARPTADPYLSNVEFEGVERYLSKLPKDKIEFLPVINPATPQKVSSLNREDKPDIFHFIGHGRLQEENGKEGGQIALVDDLGNADWKDAKMFSDLFNGHPPKIVILQACETGKQSETNAFSSELMLQGIPVVIAMQYNVSNLTASSFVKDFYEEIIKGNSVDVAVQQARYNIALANEYKQRDFAIPVIYMNASDGYLFPEKIKLPSPDTNGGIINIRLQSLQKQQKQQKQIESQIANLERLRNNCNLQIQGEGDSDKRSQLRIKMNNYSTEIEQLYDELERVEQKINKISIS